MRSKRTWPEVYSEYRKKVTSSDSSALMGKVLFVNVKSPTYIIANMFSQFHYIPRGIAHTNSEAFKECLKRIKNFALSLYHSSAAIDKIRIGFPYKIGCGLGGGNWSEINTLLKIQFEDNPYIKAEIWEK